MTRQSSVRAILTRSARVLDWRFMVALCLLILTAAVVVGGYREQTAKGARIDSLIRAAQVQDARSADQEAKARAERAELLRLNRAAARERERLLAEQRHLAARLAAVLAYLQAHGLTPPAEELPQVNKRTAAGVALEDPETTPIEQNPPRPRPRALAPQAQGTPPPGAATPAPEQAPTNPVQGYLDGVLRGLLR